jgi:hypothetical protein
LPAGVLFARPSLVSQRNAREDIDAELNGQLGVLSMVNLSGSRGFWKIVSIGRFTFRPF